MPHTLQTIHMLLEVASSYECNQETLSFTEALEIAFAWLRSTLLLEAYENQWANLTIAAKEPPTASK